MIDYDFNIDSIQTVSYTHLDVYKRQASGTRQCTQLQGMEYKKVLRLREVIREVKIISNVITAYQELNSINPQNNK